ncbi:hypothetical protein [Fluviicola taffensis]|uniref:hypothetical protein n=1 Tax=Fluviicola taffensis TaxID=191579 RepID=UPI003137A280
MNRQGAYRIWLKLVIKHAYFDTQQCGLILEPDSITNRLLQKAGILLKQQNSCTWILVAEDEIKLDTEINLCFQLKTKQADFYYYTDQSTVDDKSWSLSDYNKSGIWKLLMIPVTDKRIGATDPETIEIQLNSALKHIEFLVFPNQSYPMEPLEVREHRGKVLFDKREELPLPGTEKTVFRFVSSETLPLKQQSAYQFHLWELRNSGENLLSRLPDFPLVQSLSPFSPKDTITSYIYL